MVKKTLVFLAFVFICFQVYRIFILSIVPYNIKDITSLFKICSICCIFITTLFMMIFQLTNLMVGEQESKLKSFLAKMINILFYNPLREIGTFLLSFNIIQYFCLTLGKIIVAGIENKKNAMVLLMIFYLIPRCLFCLFLFVDVIYLQQIHLILKNIIIISWPLIYSAVFGLLQLHIEGQKVFLEKSHINVVVQQNPFNVFVYPKTKETNPLYINQYYSTIFLQDRLLALSELLQHVKIRILNVIILIILTYCWSQYLDNL